MSATHEVADQLTEALERWREGSEYKGKYLREKHEDDKDIAEARAALDRLCGLLPPLDSEHKLCPPISGTQARITAQGVAMTPDERKLIERALAALEPATWDVWLARRLLRAALGEVAPPEPEGSLPEGGREP